MSDDESVNKLEVFEKNIRLFRKYGKVQRLQIKRRDPFIPRNMEQDIRKRVKTMRAITPNSIAEKFDLRVSAVKKLLLTLEKEGKIERIVSSSRIKIFKPVEEDEEEEDEEEE